MQRCPSRTAAQDIFGLMIGRETWTHNANTPDRSIGATWGFEIIQSTARRQGDGPSSVGRIVAGIAGAIAARLHP